ncbi:S41 family peptidase [Streptomyces sp. NPDC059909]|uniref:S41 family peptidase n=1 Tax=Streptomyces sp. NPDC059909 TaxID=3346998 RepID=UPI00365EB49E
MRASPQQVRCAQCAVEESRPSPADDQRRGDMTVPGRAAAGKRARHGGAAGVASTVDQRWGLVREQYDRIVSTPPRSAGPRGRADAAALHPRRRPAEALERLLRSRALGDQQGGTGHVRDARWWLCRSPPAPPTRPFQSSVARRRCMSSTDRTQWLAPAVAAERPGVTSVSPCEGNACIRSSEIGACDDLLRGRRRITDGDSLNPRHLPGGMMTSPADDSRPDFIERAAEPVRDHLAASTPLSTFLQGAGTLTLEERRLIVDQALVLLEQNYVHLPLKVAMHAVNPVQRLRVLRRRLERQTPQTMPREWLFHAEMSEIFHSVRDLHTNYLLPNPFAGKIAFLPFLIEQYTEQQETRFMVTHVAQGFSAPGFGPGAEITHWSGIPIADAVDLNAVRFAGSNTAARRSRGVQSLTVRPLAMHLPPFEEWVTVTYIDSDDGRTKREVRENWRIVDNLPAFVDADTVSAAAASQGLDLDADEAGRAKVMLFAPRIVAQEHALQAGESIPELRQGEVATTMPRVFKAREVRTSSGTFGHIRIFTFNVDDPVAFVNEFVRLIGQLPDRGLIVDVRDNGGGHIHAAEFALQVLTPRRVVPEPVQFITTPLNLRICRAHERDPLIDLGPWVASMDQAVEIGAAFSGAFPITPEDGANAIGQQYFGPVVLITNARCYSATDIFAAGFQDHRIGPVLGTDENTGAGGANVWTHRLLSLLLQDDTATPYVPLPKGAGMRVSIRRTLRVGAQSGAPVEDLGITPDERHQMTRRDLIEDNADLLERAGRHLKSLIPHAVSITDAVSVDGGLRLKVKATNVDRVDVYLDQRPRASVDLSDGQADVTVPDTGAAQSARVEGFEAGRLVASKTEPVP